MMHISVVLFLVTAAQSYEFDSSELSMVQRRSWEKKQDEAEHDGPPPEDPAQPFQAFQAVLQSMLAQAMDFRKQAHDAGFPYPSDILPGILASLGAVVEAVGEKMNGGITESEYTIRSGNAFIESQATLSSNRSHVLTTTEQELVDRVQDYLVVNFERGAKVLLMMDKVTRGEMKDLEQTLNDFRELQSAKSGLDAVLWREVAEKKQNVTLVLSKDPLPPPPPDGPNSQSGPLPPPPPDGPNSQIGGPPPDFHDFEDFEEPPHPTDFGFLRGFTECMQGILARAMAFQTKCSDCLSKVLDGIFQGIGGAVEKTGQWINDRWYGGVSGSTYTLRAGNAYNEADSNEELLHRGTKFFVGYYRRGAAMLIVLDKVMKGEVTNPENVIGYIEKQQKLNQILDTTLQRYIDHE